MSNRYRCPRCSRPWLDAGAVRCACCVLTTRGGAARSPTHLCQTSPWVDPYCYPVRVVQEHLARQPLALKRPVPASSGRRGPRNVVRAHGHHVHGQCVLHVCSSIEPLFSNKSNNCSRPVRQGLRNARIPLPHAATCVKVWNRQRQRGSSWGHKPMRGGGTPVLCALVCRAHPPTLPMMCVRRQRGQVQMP